MERLKKRPQETEKGVTLVELLASLALLSLVVVLAMSIFSVAQNAFRVSSEKEQAQDSATLAMKDITRAIRSAGLEEITVANAGLSPAEETFSDRCGNIQLSGAIAFDNGVELFSEENSFHYYLEGDSLFNDGRLVAESIHEVRFIKAAEQPIEEAGTDCPLVIVEIDSTHEDISLSTEIFIRQ